MRKKPFHYCSVSSMKSLPILDHKKGCAPNLQLMKSMGESQQCSLTLSSFPQKVLELIQFAGSQLRETCLDHEEEAFFNLLLEHVPEIIKCERSLWQRVKEHERCCMEEQRN